MIRFVYKSKFALSAKDEISKEKIIENSYLSKSNNRVILGFINRQNIFIYEKDENGFINKRILDKIRVRVEVEI